MNRILSNSLLSALLAFSLTLTGCASSGGQPDAQVDPRLTQGQDATFFSSSGLTACAAAAGVGVLACALAAENKVGCMVVAGIGACGVALGANYYYDYRRSKYANATERLQKMNDEVKADTDKVALRSATLQQVIGDDKQRIAQLKKSIQAKTVNKAAAQQQVADIDANIKQMRTDVGNMRNKVAQYQKTAQLERQNGAGNNIAVVEAEIAKMNAKVNSLQQEVDGLYSQRSAITLG
ncbi:hypothetical protein SJI00_06740 [Pseudomonas sp. RP23018S]|uniref:hypothetical protein n=1 Tax=Pseudomonas sp. RP23018S TaxID=3096037 RepID=UPI002ACAC412|nr:hypothetical protein [Pseudomonas sp. RP23018S]MDZ5602465.1 hypothetical protein [Pseudomonas sp. RP23018S]